MHIVPSGLDFGVGKKSRFGCGFRRQHKFYELPAEEIAYGLTSCDYFFYAAGACCFVIQVQRRIVVPTVFSSNLSSCSLGPCPPCPAQCRVACFCGAQQNVVRCGTQPRSCGGKCGRGLFCGIHYCQDPCHPGNCPPCTKKDTKKCACGMEQKLQLCEVKDWHCARWEEKAVWAIAWLLLTMAGQGEAWTLYFLLADLLWFVPSIHLEIFGLAIKWPCFPTC